MFDKGRWRHSSHVYPENAPNDRFPRYSDRMAEITFTVVHRARNGAEAQIIRALLRGAGISARLSGEYLMDDFALSQRMMGLAGVAVEVPTSDLQRSRELIQEAREVGRERKEPDEDATSDR